MKNNKELFILLIFHQNHNTLILPLFNDFDIISEVASMVELSIFDRFSMKIL